MESSNAEMVKNAPAPTAKDITPEELYYAMGQLGMKNEQRQFEKDMLALQDAAGAKVKDLTGQYQALRKKGALTSAIGSAFGAVAGGIAGLLIGNKKQNWGPVRKGALTVGGGIAGVSVFGMIANMFTRKQVSGFQQDAMAMQDRQTEAVRGIVSKYSDIVQQYLYNKQTPMPVQDMPAAIAPVVTEKPVAPPATPETQPAQEVKEQQKPSTCLAEPVAAQAIEQTAARALH